MNLNIIASISIIVLTIGLIIVFWYIVLILANIMRILKPIDKIASELEKEFTPLMSDMAGIAFSLKNFVARIDRISGLIFGKADFMAQGFEKLSGYFQNFIRNPKVEIESLGAGLKKALDILLSRKEGNNNG